MAILAFFCKKEKFALTKSKEKFALTKSVCKEFIGDAIIVLANDFFEAQIRESGSE